jgi:hypothetical protein
MREYKCELIKAASCLRVFDKNRKFGGDDAGVLIFCRGTRV